MRGLMVAAALLFASGVARAACLNPPRFSDAKGVVCSVARQQIECGCSEALVWDAPATLVTQWEVEARALVPGGVPGGVWHRVGLVPYERLLYVYRKGSGWAIHGIPSTRMWTPALETPMPAEGVLYKYRVRALKLGVPGAWSEEIYYRGTLYRVWL